MSFEVKQATRQGVKPLVGMYGRSGSGKTLSALYLARGFAGKDGVITLIDSESGRGSLFADLVPGGYRVIEINPPFSPERYQEAFEVAEKDSACVVIDSLSHEHAGEGGVLQMHDEELDRMAGKEDWKKREACKMAAWIKPKAAHKRFIQRILRSRCALICCLRGEEKTHIVPAENGKKTVVTDEFSTPIFDSRFIFELLLNFETLNRNGEGGFVYPTKITHPALRDLIPKENEQITIRHGEAIADWCKAPAVGAAQKPKKSTTDALKSRIWTRAKGHFKEPAALEQWLREKGQLEDGTVLGALNEAELGMIAEYVETELDALF